MTAETGAPERAQWITNLDEVAALEPPSSPATKRVDNNNDPTIIAGIPAISAGFLPDRAEETTVPASWPGWSNAIPIGRTSAHSAILRDQPSRGRAAK
jgi:hypothetical protein